MNVLITGGAGFIGSSLALELILNGHSVIVMDNLSPQIHGNDPYNSPTLSKIKDKVKFIKGDVSNREDWKLVLPNVECVIHLAAETGTGQSMYQAHHYMNINVGGTAHLLDLLSEEGKHVKRVIIASSRAIYGEGKYIDQQGRIHYPLERIAANLKRGIFNPMFQGEELSPVPTSEDTPLSPSSIYGLSKQVQEQMVLMGAITKGISGIALRYQNVYGPGQSLKNPYTGIISIFSKLLLRNKPINIFEDGKETRDFVFIDDVVRATRLAVEHDDKSLVASVNVGSGNATSVNQITSTLKQLYDSSSEISVSGNYRLGDIRHNVADLDKAKKILSFEPKVGLEEGLKMFVDWVKTQEISDDNSYEQSLIELKEKNLFK